MKKHIFAIAVICGFLFVSVQNGFAFSKFDQGCNNCHTAADIHSKEGHTACINCHPTASGGAGTVTPDKCVVCHPRGTPGECDLVKFPSHASVNCVSCHTDCKSACPAATVLGDDDPRLVTLRKFRNNVLNKSALGKRLVAIYYNNAGAINAALQKNPTLKAFSHKALQSFIPVVEIFM
jgi:hypothetical protein